MKSEVLGTTGEQILENFTRDEIDLDYYMHNVSVQTGEEFSLQFLQNLTRRRKMHGGGSGSSQEYQNDHVISGRTIQTAKNCSQGLHATFTKIPTGNVTEQKGVGVGVGIQFNQNEQLVYEYHIDSRVSKNDPVNGTEWSDFWGGKGLQLEAEKIAYKDYTIKGYNQHTTNETHIHKTKCQPYNCMSGAPDGSYSEKLKFLCSFGGRILTRPSDGKLRYVGGDTRIISVKNNLNYQELMKKTYTICNQPHIIKYQLPGEDLEALISVCSDEDFHHMIDEFHELEKGSQRLRIFLESLNERESPCSFEARSIQQTDTAYKYVVAVNGITDSASPINITRSSSNLSRKLPSPARLLQSPSFQYRDRTIEQSTYENPFLDDSLTLGTYQQVDRRLESHKTREDHSHDEGLIIYGQSSVEFNKHMIKESAIQIEKFVPFHKQDKNQIYKCEWDQDTIMWMDKNSLNMGFDLDIDEYQHNLSPATPLERQLSMATTVSTSDTVSNISSGLQHPQSDHILNLDFNENDHIIYDLVVPNSAIFAPITSDVSLGESSIDNLGDMSMSQTSEDISDSLPDDLLLSTTELLYIQETHTENESVSRSDSKDVEDDKRMRHEPISDATMAEIQAGIHGLQTIKNADLEELHELGCGTFGTVYHGKWRGTDVAIKRIKEICFLGKPSEQDRLRKDFWREAQILSQLHHPNVVALYGVVRDGPEGTLSTVTEYMANGSLRHVLSKRNKVLDKRKRLIIAQDAAIGMEYLHLKNIVHFDLKCDNLLVNLGDPDRPICKVGDFGLSRIKGNSLVSGGARGTLPWIAPELLDGNSSRVSEKVDVFSFGITMWEILTGEEPYADMHCGAIIGGIVTNTLRPLIPRHCDHDWKELMEECWSNDPQDRPSFTQITNKLQAMSLAFRTKRQKCPRRQ